MSGGGCDIGEAHNDFYVFEWCESRGGKVSNFTWQICKVIPSDELENSKYYPTILEFDAAQKKLCVNLNFAHKFGVDVEIVPLDPDFDEKNKRK